MAESWTVPHTAGAVWGPVQPGRGTVEVGALQTKNGGKPYPRKPTNLLSVVELVGELVAALVILVKRLAEDLDQRLVLRGGGGRGHDGEQHNL